MDNELPKESMLTEKALNIFKQNLNNGESVRVFNNGSYTIKVKKKKGKVFEIQEPALQEVSEAERLKAMEKIFKEGLLEDYQGQKEVIDLTKNINLVKDNGARIVTSK